MEKTAFLTKQAAKLKMLLLLLVIFSFSHAYAQNGSITGTVMNDKGENLPGATVSVEEKGTNVMVDSDGKYTITGLAPGTYKLSVSFVGYDSAERTVTVCDNETQTADFVLLTTARTIDEVVVIGYGTARKRDLTGSMVTIGEKDFNKGVITNPDQLIQGKTPGVMIINNTGQPGGSVTVRICGNYSIRASNNTPFVLDVVHISGNSPVPVVRGYFNYVECTLLTYLN